MTGLLTDLKEENDLISGEDEPHEDVSLKTLTFGVQ